MDADPVRVHHSLLAQVQDYANCNLFAGQESKECYFTLYAVQASKCRWIFPSLRGQLKGLSNTSEQCPGKICRDSWDGLEIDVS